MTESEVKELVKLVSSIVRRRVSSFPPSEDKYQLSCDLIQSSLEVAVKAHGNYREKLGAYKSWIAAIVERALADAGRKAGPLSRAARRQVRLMREARARWQRSHNGVPPNEQQLLDELSWTDDKLQSVLRDESAGTDYIEDVDKTGAVSSTSPVADIMRPGGILPVEQDTHEADLRRTAAECFARLTEEERAIVRLSHAGATLKIIGRIMGLTIPTAQRRLDGAQSKLKLCLKMAAKRR